MLDILWPRIVDFSQTWFRLLNCLNLDCTAIKVQSINNLFLLTFCYIPREVFCSQTHNTLNHFNTTESWYHRVSNIDRTAGLQLSATHGLLLMQKCCLSPWQLGLALSHSGLPLLPMTHFRVE